MISGASGFIGSTLSSRLVEIGAHVTGLSRTPPSDNRIDWITCDVTDEKSVRNAVCQAKPNVIYHLASEVTGARSREWIAPCFHANLASTVYMMTAAADAGVERFVQMGSQEEPDSSKGDVIPTSPYAAAKWAASAYARMFHNLYGFGVVHLRVFMVYGPGQMDLKKLIPYCTLECLAGRRPQIGFGTRRVDWVYVDDVVRGLLLSGTVPGVEGKTFEIGTSKLTSLREVVERVVRTANPAITAEFSKEGRAMEIEYSADYSQSEALLGWRPSVTMDEGIQRTVDWYSANFVRLIPKPLASA
ncbi:MAG: NAD-dependent epimerase/dehydratase family protein [Planctomycetota bacterium]|nr:NAD-dependent epimerase/dehydratase family protein [Planctomycetota bacterium]